MYKICVISVADFVSHRMKDQPLELRRSLRIYPHSGKEGRPLICISQQGINTKHTVIKVKLKCRFLILSTSKTTAIVMRSRNQCSTTNSYLSLILLILLRYKLILQEIILQQTFLCSYINKHSLQLNRCSPLLMDHIINTLHMTI